MKTQKHKGVFFSFFKWQDATLVEEKTKKQKKTKRREKNGTVKTDEQEGGLRRPTGWYEVWRSMQKSTRKRELLQKCHRWASGWTPARLKRRGARGVFPARIRDPFESGTIQSEVPRLWKESLLHLPGLAGWYILFYSTHAHIHSSEMPSLYSQSSRPPEAEDASTSGGGSTASYTAWKTLLQSLVSNWRCLQASSNRKITS